MLFPVLCGSADIYHPFPALMPLSLPLSLKDAELRSSSQDFQKIVEEPQEPVTPEGRERESIQVTEIILPMPGTWDSPRGFLGGHSYG